MNFELVLVSDIKNGLGNHNGLFSWDIKEDMQFFKKLTYGHTIIMGKNTANTFKIPLKNRINIVITQEDNYRLIEGFISFKTLDEALIYSKNNKIYVIGGAKLAEYAIQHRHCRGVYLNKIYYDYNCDISLSNKFMNVLNTFEQQHNEQKLILCKKLNNNSILEFTYYTYKNTEEIQYINLLDKIIHLGECKTTRNGNTYSVFGERLEFNLTNGFPLITTKKMFYRGIFEELLFFLQGKTDTKLLEDKKIMIWHDNTTQEFINNNNKNLQEYDMGPMYGFQWRHYGTDYKGCHQNYANLGIDQLSQVINLLVNDPASRRILMTTYNVSQVEQGVLYPCHGLQVQFNVEKQKYINLQMYQRSADCILGLPFNIASYALLLHIITNLVNNNKNRTHINDYIPGRIIIILGDAHIYSDEKTNHFAVALEHIKRKSHTYKFCDINISKKLLDVNDIDSLTINDININNYVSNGFLKASMVA